MTRGRRPDGARLVERLEGSSGAKARLGMILDVLAGRRTVGQSCARLRLSERRFHGSRHRALQAALSGLEPCPAGHPARGPAGADARAALQAEVRDLRLELRAAQVREEIALVMPGLLWRSGGRTAARRPRGREPCATGGAPATCGASAPTRPAQTGLSATPPASGRPGGASAASAPGPPPSAAGPPATASP
jgi:hypothetical protein